MVTSFDKALVALIVSAVVGIGAHYGLNLDATFSAALTTVLTTIAVYLFPNKQAAA